MTQINPHRYQDMLASASTPTKKEETKKTSKPDRINGVIWALLIALILFGGLIYLKESISTPPAYKYSNGDSEFEVRRVSDTHSQIQFYYGDSPEPYVMDLRYGPIDLEDIEIEGADLKEKILNDNTVYITFDPEEELKGEAVLAGLEIGKFIGNKYFFNIPVKSAVTREYNNNTVITCEDASFESTVIWIRKGEETRVRTDESCIIIEGPTETEMVKAADRLALHLIGIMP